MNETLMTTSYVGGGGQQQKKIHIIIKYLKTSIYPSLTYGYMYSDIRMMKYDKNDHIVDLFR
ncbi:hypothetical protein DERF_013158 [Dermatophagoides farinae]|uniref:Uncharacterized protein n=1 Tax=Dermatophagoides farinae TaxID=6954 RepID=A0A922HL83_DERFA|nr:hypothetical protein DERF_013158 [Dermatophagoides farinae]